MTEEIIRALLAGTPLAAIVAAWVAFRRERRTDRTTEMDLLDRIRAVAREEIDQARAELQAAREDLEHLRDRVAALEASRHTDQMVISGLRTHISYLVAYIGRHLPDGTPPPEPIPAWLQ